ncbi:MAG: hypothetical protein ACMXYL_03760 [Candidatus Woesearchaeota archaeon]
MEYRKIIGFGKSSFVVSVPKSWISNNNLTKGSTVTVSAENDHLLISASPLSESKPENKTISIETKGKSNKFLQREIISAYISGYDTICIVGDNLREKRRSITDAFKNLVALEIIRQDDEMIVAKDFLDIEDINLKEIIRKIDNNVRSMMIEVMEMLKAHAAKHPSQVEVDENLLQVRERDDSINRLSFLCFRSIKDLLLNPSKTRESMIDLFKAWTTVMYLERTGDEVKRLYRNSVEFRLSKKEYEQINMYISDMLELYKNVMRIYHVEEQSLKKTKNYEIAEKCRVFQQKAREKIATADKKSERTIAVYERISNIVSYFEEILRLTYDFL